MGVVRACARSPNADPVAAAGSIAPEVSLHERLDALYTRCPSPFVQLSLGAAEARLHHGVRAWTLLREALASGDPLVEANRADIAQNVLPGVRQSVVLIAPTSEVAGATLTVNGRAVGSLPLPRPYPVEPGEVTIEVDAPGYERASRRVALAGGWGFDEAVVLVRARALPEAPQAVAFVRAPAQTGRLPGRTQRVVGWTLVGAGAALGIAGAVFWRLSYDTAQGIEGYCEANGSDPACVRAQAQNYDRLRVDAFCNDSPGADAVSMCARYEPQAILGWALGVGGLAALGTGVVLLATAPRAVPPVRVSAWLRGDSGGVVVRGDF